MGESVNVAVPAGTYLKIIKIRRRLTEERGRQVTIKEVLEILVDRAEIQEPE